MSQAENEVNVTVTIGDVKVEFSGSAETVTASVMNFLLKEVPSMDLARKILLNYAAQELIETYSHLIKITPEGPRVIPNTDVKLSDKDIVALQLCSCQNCKGSWQATGQFYAGIRHSCCYGAQPKVHKLKNI